MDPKDIQPRLAATLKQLRLARGLSYREAAKLLGIGASHLHHIETEAYAPTLETLARIAAGYGMTLPALLKRAGIL